MLPDIDRVDAGWFVLTAILFGPSVATVGVAWLLIRYRGWFR